jgi:RNA polymerase sigma factor (sigma-70 family)
MPHEPSLPEDLASLLQQMRAAKQGGPDHNLIRLVTQLRQAAKRHLPNASPLRMSMDSEDLVQETLVHLIANVDAFRGTTWAEFLAFTRTITNQRAADQARKLRSRRRDPTDPEQVISDQPSLDPTPSVQAAAAEDKLRLARILEDLPDPYRKTLRLRLDGHESSSIAAMLGISDDTVRQRLTRALRMLQERW